MTYKVSALDTLRMGESESVRAILRNIAVILATRKGSVPLYRDFGVSWDALDKPMPIAKAMMIPEVREAVERWEPRAVVHGVEFQQDPARPGTWIPVVEVELSEEDGL